MVKDAGRIASVAASFEARCLPGLKTALLLGHEQQTRKLKYVRHANHFAHRDR